MRIALVTGHVTPESSADVQADPREQAFRVATLAGTLAGLGHQVTVYARKDSAARPDSQNAGGVRFEYVPAGPAAALPQDRLLQHLGTFSNELARRWQRQPPDVVHAHFWTSGVAALAATRGSRVPVVQSFHSLGTPRATSRPDRPARSQHGSSQDASARHDSARHDGRHDSARHDVSQPADQAMVRARLERLVARTVRSVLAGSSAELARLADYGVPRTAITVVPFGVDTTRFDPAGPAARRGKRPRLLAAAPTSGNHGLDTVIQALAALPGTELLIAGGPPRAEIGTDPVLHGLALRAERAGVSDRVMFTGKVSQARVPALLRSADLFVHVASGEPTGILPVEAMACGTAVVAAEDGADQDAVVDGATGVLVRPGDPASLARRIRQLLASPMLLEGLGIAAADRARSRYSWERIGQETVAAYQRAA